MWTPGEEKNTCNARFQQRNCIQNIKVSLQVNKKKNNPVKKKTGAKALSRNASHLANKSTHLTKRLSNLLDISVIGKRKWKSQQENHGRSWYWQNPSWVRMRSCRSPRASQGGVWNGWTTLEDGSAVPELVTRSPWRPGHSPPGCHTKTRVWLFTAALCIIASNCQKPKELSKDEWRNKLEYIQTIKYYSTTTKDELTADKCRSTDKSRGRYVEQKKPGRKNPHYLCVFNLYMRF